jgi:hypothetical protein
LGRKYADRVERLVGGKFLGHAQRAVRLVESMGKGRQAREPPIAQRVPQFADRCCRSSGHKTTPRLIRRQFPRPGAVGSDSRRETRLVSRSNTAGGLERPRMLSAKSLVVVTAFRLLRSKPRVRSLGCIAVGT